MLHDQALLFRRISMETTFGASKHTSMSHSRVSVLLLRHEVYCHRGLGPPVPGMMEGSRDAVFLLLDSEKWIQRK